MTPYVLFRPLPALTLRSRLRREQTKWPAPRPSAALADFVLLLSPYAPHIAEELWGRLGHDGSITYVPWPAVDESLLVQSTVQLPVQVRHGTLSTGCTLRG